jgi:glycine dehydrogenase subunit 1
MSQGTLQAIYEYQTLAAQLLGMEIATASHYDGATALAESLLMAIRITKRKKVAVSSLIHPLYRQVVRTYFEPTGFEVVELGYLENGMTDIAGLDDMDDLAAVAIQSPNFFGCIENLQAAGEKAHDNKALFIASFTEALAYGLLKSPGAQGADICMRRRSESGDTPFLWRTGPWDARKQKEIHAQPAWSPGGQNQRHGRK